MIPPTEKFSGRACRGFALVCLVLLAGVWIAYLCGARINRTHSLPKGLYWVVNKIPERGDVVTFWPDDSEPFRMARERGYIIPGPYNDRGAGGYDLMMKKLLALPGDVVSLTSTGVFVNGGLIANTQPLYQDNVGAPLPVLRFANYRLRDDEILFLSDHLPTSFDARYFGVQNKRQIVEVLVPLWVM